MLWVGIEVSYIKNLISTSERHVEHLFVSRNTQHPVFSLRTSFLIFRFQEKMNKSTKNVLSLHDFESNFLRQDLRIVQIFFLLCGNV